MATLWHTVVSYVPSRTTAWLLLVLSGLTEVGWAISIKYTDGFSRLWPSVVTIAFLIAGFPMLAAVLRTLPSSTAYACWTGTGIAGTALIGMTVLHEPAGARKIACLVLILLGVIGLKLLSSET